MSTDLIQLGEQPQKQISELEQRQLQAHCAWLVSRLALGEAIPFLGAGINLCDRQPEDTFKLDHRLPSGRELAEILAKWCEYPWADRDNLLRVSWYATFIKETTVDLYIELQKIFGCIYPPTSAHNFFATLPKSLRDKGYQNCYQVIVTTNYDDVLERAFEAADEPFDVVSYVAVDEQQRGKFLHIPYKEEPRLIHDTTSYANLPIDAFNRVERTIILKLHGAVDRKHWSRCSFVVTEDDYIDYLARMDIANPLPPMLATKMRFSSFLFMGYSLSDWNLRVILHRIWATGQFSPNSWAILDKADESEETFWKSRRVKFLKVLLAIYIQELNNQLDALQKR